MSQKELDLAKQAKSALENPALIEAFARYEKKVIEQIKAADYKDRDLLDTLKRHLTSLSVVRRNLEVMMEDGEVRKQINLEQTAFQRAKTAFRRIA